jgi:hypothetical protein
MFILDTALKKKKGDRPESSTRLEGGESFYAAERNGHLAQRAMTQIDPPLRANLDRRGREIFDNLVSCKPSFDWRQNDILMLATIAAIEVRVQDVLTMLSNVDPFKVTDDSSDITRELQRLTMMTTKLYMAVGLGVINTTSGSVAQVRNKRVQEAIERSSESEDGLLAGM